MKTHPAHAFCDIIWLLWNRLLWNWLLWSWLRVAILRGLNLLMFFNLVELVSNLFRTQAAQSLSLKN
jgi:hypothetical protein